MRLPSVTLYRRPRAEPLERALKAELGMPELRRVLGVRRSRRARSALSTTGSLRFEATSRLGARRIVRQSLEYEVSEFLRPRRHERTEETVSQRLGAAQGEHDRGHGSR